MNNKKRVTLYIDSSVYDKFKKYCENNGLILSKQFEMFLENELKKRVER